MNEAPLLGRKAVESWMLGYIASVIDVRREDISLTEPFNIVGLDSAEVVIMAGVMEEEFAIEVDPNLLFDEPSVTGVLDTLEKAGIIWS